MEVNPPKYIESLFPPAELSMANCSKVDNLGFGELKKAWALSRLDLSRTRIDFHTLQLLLQHAGQLRHLSLSNCTQLDMDEVALTLATFSRGLISLSAWKTRGITTRGLRALACIPTLQDLDLGWALSGAITEGLGELVRGCKGLRRLYLTALRTLTDNDLHQLTTHAGQLTWLDIMGTRNVTPEAVHSTVLCTFIGPMLRKTKLGQMTVKNIASKLSKS
nr:F-box/LRR-repeat protein 4-like isoform X2 [Cherax quadricarinatus]